jgi:hypothetical protein
VNKWAVGAIGSILGFLIAQILSIYQFQKGIEVSQKVEKIHLARELIKDFYADDAKTFKETLHNSLVCVFGARPV